MWELPRQGAQILLMVVASLLLFSVPPAIWAWKNDVPQGSAFCLRLGHPKGFEEKLNNDSQSSKAVRAPAPLEPSEVSARAPINKL